MRNFATCDFLTRVFFLSFDEFLEVVLRVSIIMISPIHRPESGITVL
jgi:hypothetical protein